MFWRAKLRPTEHGALLKFLRNAPASVRVVDHIEYEDAPTAEKGHDADGGHPVPPGGRGAIHVVTDLIGATAVLRGPAGRVVNQCQTPCSFNDLAPAQYSLEVEKEGYQPMQTALQVKAGSVVDQKATLESLAKGLYLTSRPAGADVFINGAKQSGQTPVTLPLAPGQYNLVVRLPGYEAYAGSVQVKDNIQTQLDVRAEGKSRVGVGPGRNDSEGRRDLCGWDDDGTDHAGAGTDAGRPPHPDGEAGRLPTGEENGAGQRGRNGQHLQRNAQTPSKMR